MADQVLIQKTIEELAEKFQIAQDEVLGAIMSMVDGKSTADAIAILNEIDVSAVMIAKSKGIISSYTQSNVNTLVTKQMFADISEDVLRTLLTQSEQYLSGQIIAMGNVMKQEIINGAINKRTAEEIADNIAKKGYASGVGMKRIVSDGLNNYSRAVTRMMMEEAPENTKYIYIGPADEKTRAFCLSAIQAGAITLNQIRSMGYEWEASLSEGGGINCRHGWEIVTEDVRSQFYRQEEAEEILDA